MSIYLIFSENTQQIKWMKNKKYELVLPLSLSLYMEVAYRFPTNGWWLI